MSTREQLAAARVTGAAARLTMGKDGMVPWDVAIAELRAITTDPVVLGQALGAYLHRVEQESAEWQETVELLRAAGADEVAAAAKLQQLAGTDARYEDGGFRL
jgi:hypothetical protein